MEKESSCGKSSLSSKKYEHNPLAVNILLPISNLFFNSKLNCSAI